MRSSGRAWSSRSRISTRRWSSPATASTPRGGDRRLQGPRRARQVRRHSRRRAGGPAERDRRPSRRRQGRRRRPPRRDRRDHRLHQPICAGPAVRAHARAAAVRRPLLGWVGKVRLGGRGCARPSRQPDPRRQCRGDSLFAGARKSYAAVRAEAEKREGASARASRWPTRLHLAAQLGLDAASPARR